MARYPQIESVLEHVQRILRTRGYAVKTQKTYLPWIRQFLMYHRTVPPRSLGKAHVVQFLEHLAEKGLAPKSRNLAASALAFLFRELRGDDVMKGVPRARGPEREPDVLSHRATLRVIRHLKGKYHFIGGLLYGTGMRLGECLGLRVKDLDFDLRQILIRDGKGQKDRYAILPDNLRPALRRQIERAAALREADKKHGAGWAPLPGAYHEKDPSAGFTLRWQFLLPSSRVTKDPTTGRRGRYHMDASGMQRAMKAAVRESGVLQTATCHTLRHTFATELVRAGCDIRRLQRLMGHKDIRVTMHYLHVVEQSGLGIRSPIDRVEDEEEPGWD
jgi:integron integrase